MIGSESAMLVDPRRDILRDGINPIEIHYSGGSKRFRTRPLEIRFRIRNPREYRRACRERERDAVGGVNREEDVEEEEEEEIWK